MSNKRLSTKEIILIVAGELFMDKGFKATSTREIALKAGITQPNLYHHFKTKEDIYVAVLEDLSAEVKDELEKIVKQDLDSLADKLLIVLDYLREKHPANFSIMSHDMTYEISKENHYHLYTLWKESYLAPLVYLFENHLPDQSRLTPYELGRHFYASIAPFIQKENRFYKEVDSEQIIYLFVYGILDRD